MFDIDSSIFHPTNSHQFLNSKLQATNYLLIIDTHWKSHFYFYFSLIILFRYGVSAIIEKGKHVRIAPSQYYMSMSVLL